MPAVAREKELSCPTPPPLMLPPPVDCYLFLPHYTARPQQFCTTPYLLR